MPGTAKFILEQLVRIFMFRFRFDQFLICSGKYALLSPNDENYSKTVSNELQTDFKAANEAWSMKDDSAVQPK